MGQEIRAVEHPDQQGRIEIGTHLFPRRADSQYHMGHMWIYWTATAILLAHRGYWPIFSLIPKEFRHPSKYREFLISNFVPGRYLDESMNPITVRIMGPFREEVLDQRWSIDTLGRTRVQLRCYIPMGCDGVDEGLYSCDENREDCENCSSWALNILRGTVGDPNFLPCERPKRLRYVEQAIRDG